MNAPAVSIDVGEARTIHTTNKQDVGARLALLAQGKTSGGKGLVCPSPLSAFIAVAGSTVRITFATGGAPLIIGGKTGRAAVEETPAAQLDCFALAGADGAYAWADAMIDGDSVVLSCAAVPKPAMVRSAWAANPEGCNLYNKAGLPASPFRADVR